MSQHLITEFINRTYVFKPFNDSKLINRPIKKYQGSNRNNNISPNMIAQSIPLKPKEIRKQGIKKNIEGDNEQKSEEKHIDIIV